MRTFKCTGDGVEPMTIEAASFGCAAEAYRDHCRALGVRLERCRVSERDGNPTMVRFPEHKQEGA